MVPKLSHRHLMLNEEEHFQQKELCWVIFTIHKVPNLHKVNTMYFREQRCPFMALGCTILCRYNAPEQISQMRQHAIPISHANKYVYIRTNRPKYAAVLRRVVGVRFSPSLGNERACNELQSTGEMRCACTFRCVCYVCGNVCI